MFMLQRQTNNLKARAASIMAAREAHPQHVPVVDWRAADQAWSNVTRAASAMVFDNAKRRFEELNK